MRIVFMGTPDFAVPVLSRLIETGHDIAAVYSQPDRPSGRGRKLVPTPTKRFAEERGIEVRQPKSLRSADECEALASLSPDVVVVAAYGLFLPPEVLNVPPQGCLNIHPSLLPRYRGPSPVVSAILNGDDETGATIMKLDERMDSGPILAQERVSIAEEETTPELTRRLFDVGADLLVDTLPRWSSGDIQATPQDESRATFTTLVKKEDGEIDWTHDAERISRMVRAYEPWPGTFTNWDGKLLKILNATSMAGDAPPGQVVGLDDGGVGIGTGDGLLGVNRLQIEGRRPSDAQDFVRGYPDFVGAELGRSS
ncbi:MAG: methionyl-tRNA formyltransferase [Chloroflexota bacterium]|nr:methionyl-tRNA formyltransferase [Chloroflexota bacterium]